MHEYFLTGFLVIAFVFIYALVTRGANKDRVPPYCTRVEDAKKDYRKFDDR